MLGSPVDLAKVDVDAYVVAGITDHLCPWQSCYRTTQLLGGPVKFVLSTSGHIAAMVNPPANPKAAFQTASGANPADPREFLASRDHGAGQLVARLRGLAGRTQRRAAQEPADARPQGLPGAGRRARNLCSRPLRCAAWPSTAGSCGSRCARPGGVLRGAGLRPGRRAPLLLINGIGASLELLEPFVGALDPALEVIRFDPPGVGGSAAPPGPYRFTGLCALIASMLTELGHDQVDVLGISWGGGVAQHFAAFQRARCRRLVLVATATGALMVPARPSVLAHMVTPRRYLDRGYLERVRRRHLRRLRAGRTPSGSRRAMHNGNRVGPSRGYLYQLTAGRGLDQRAVPAAAPPADAHPVR